MQDEDRATFSPISHQLGILESLEKKQCYSQASLKTDFEMWVVHIWKGSYFDFN